MDQKCEPRRTPGVDQDNRLITKEISLKKTFQNNVKTGRRLKTKRVFNLEKFQILSVNSGGSLNPWI